MPKEEASTHSTYCIEGGKKNTPCNHKKEGNGKERRPWPT